MNELKEIIEHFVSGSNNVNICYERIKTWHKQEVEKLIPKVVDNIKSDCYEIYYNDLQSNKDKHFTELNNA